MTGESARTTEGCEPAPEGQERPPGGVQMAGCRPVTPGPQDPPHGRLADQVTESAQLAMHPAVSPGGVLLRQPQHQVADLRAGSRTACLARKRPLAADQTTVQGQ